MVASIQLALVDAMNALVPVTASGKDEAKRIRAKAAPKAKAVEAPAPIAAPASKLATDKQCADLTNAVFDSAVSRRLLGQKLLKVLGATPSLEAFDRVKPHLVRGYVMAALIKKLTGAIDDKARAKLLADVVYLEANPAKRDDDQRKAFRSAAASLSSLLNLAGITSPAAAVQGGGDSSAMRKPRQPVADSEAKVATVADPVVLGKVKDFASLLSYVETQAVAMSRSMNGNAKLVDADRPGDALLLSTLVGDFAAGVAKLVASRK